MTITPIDFLLLATSNIVQCIFQSTFSTSCAHDLDHHEPPHHFSLAYPLAAADQLKNKRLPIGSGGRGTVSFEREFQRGNTLNKSVNSRLRQLPHSIFQLSSIRKTPLHFDQLPHCKNFSLSRMSLELQLPYAP